MPLTAQPKLFACVRAKSLQSCLTLCDLMDCSLPDSSVPGILQARILEWIAVPSSRGSSRSRDRTHVSYVSCIAGGFFKHLLNTPYMMHTVLEDVIKKWIGLIPSLFLTWFNEKTDHVWTLTIRVKVKVKSLNRVWLFATPWTVAHHAWDSPGKNTWSGLPFPSPGDPPDPVIKPRSPAL